VFAEAAVVGQPGTVATAGAVLVIGPSSRLETVTTCAMSGVKPTAPFHLKLAAVSGKATPGEPPLRAPSVVAGSPRCSVPVQVVGVGQFGAGHGVLNLSGNWVDGRPAATSAKPESGPNENMNVCVPSASVM
jgi:hypothetical protein